VAGPAERPARMRHALRYLLRKQRYQAQPRAMLPPLQWRPTSKRVGGHALAQPLRMAERAAEAVDATVTEPGPGCAPARDASLQERVATRRRNLLWGTKWRAGA